MPSRASLPSDTPIFQFLVPQPLACFTTVLAIGGFRARFGGELSKAVEAAASMGSVNLVVAPFFFGLPTFPLACDAPTCCQRVGVRLFRVDLRLFGSLLAFIDLVTE